MNDRHPSAGPAPSVPAPDASYGYYPSYEQQSSPQSYGQYDGYSSGQWDVSSASGTSGHWDTTSQWGVTGQTQTWDFSGYDLGGQAAPHGTGQYPTGQHHTGEYTGQWDTSGQWDTGAWSAAGSAAGSYDTGQHQANQWDTGAHPQSWDTSGQQYSSQSWDTSGWAPSQGQPQGQSQDESWAADLSAQQTQAWDTSAYAAMENHRPEARTGPASEPQATHAPTLMVDLSGVDLSDAGQDPAPTATVPGPRSVADAETRTMMVVEPPEPDAPDDDAPASSPARQDDAPDRSRASRRKGAPARAGYRPRRKALLTVAVPSVAVMGVAGIAAASVVAGGGDKESTHTTAASAPDTSVKLSAANSKLDTQLASLSRGADDFASRANRTQERIDLKARQEEERKRKAEEAARKERERPKFALPVSQHGLSAMYGQAGVNWMSVHTGIDFPVAYGTPVMAATDGTVRTQYNVAYGNMAIVTSPDGTETWYCHLSSTKVRSGSVKAGDVIAYSGNSGNSTGPHLHFEVRPGGSAVDPLPWLRGHNLNPT
ncbi:M23 family metallopeptidase [Streptomyces sp. NPDC046261]|uniref:M23 family metallopeptidase n=1 Tax=Streptomyces sp. NPDC046261 TaxID=3157200 RepID=UPI00340CCA5A